MSWAGTAITPLAVRMLTAPAAPLTIGPHQTWPLAAVTVTVALAAVLVLAAGHQPDSAAITARIKATMVSRIPARSRPAAAAAAPGVALAPSAVSLTG